jgi:hypothetical protein
VREKRGGVVRELEAGQRGRVVLGNRGRREKKGGEGKWKGKEKGGKEKGRKGKEKEKERKMGRRKKNGGRKRKEKGRKRGDARWRYSRRRPRLVGHARAMFARCARKKRGKSRRR